MEAQRNDRVVMHASPTAEFRVCRLQYVASLVGACPEDRCPFWEPGGAVLDGRCALEQLSTRDSRTLGTWFPQIRAQLQRAQTDQQRNEVRRLFYRLLSQSQGE